MGHAHSPSSSDASTTDDSPIETRPSTTGTYNSLHPLTANVLRPRLIPLASRDKELPKIQIQSTNMSIHSAHLSSSTQATRQTPTNPSIYSNDDARVSVTSIDSSIDGSQPPRLVPSTSTTATQMGQTRSRVSDSHSVSTTEGSFFRDEKRPPPPRPPRQPKIETMFVGKILADDPRISSPTLGPRTTGLRLGETPPPPYTNHLQNVDQPRSPLL
jgi:hypothetical protein